MNLSSVIKFAYASFTIAVTLLTAGCAASGAHFPGPRLSIGDTAEIVLYRLDRFRGSVATMDVFIDGKEVANVKNAGWAAVKVEPGEHVLELFRNNALGTYKDRGFKVVVALGDQRLVRIEPDAPGTVVVLPSGPVAVLGKWGFVEVGREQGLFELRDLRESR